MHDGLLPFVKFSADIVQRGLWILPSLLDLPSSPDSPAVPLDDDGLLLPLECCGEMDILMAYVVAA